MSWPTTRLAAHVGRWVSNVGSCLPSLGGNQPGDLKGAGAIAPHRRMPFFRDLRRQSGCRAGAFRCRFRRSASPKNATPDFARGCGAPGLGMGQQPVARCGGKAMVVLRARRRCAAAAATAATSAWEAIGRSWPVGPDCPGRMDGWFERAASRWRWRLRCSRARSRALSGWFCRGPKCVAAGGGDAAGVLGRRRWAARYAVPLTLLAAIVL